MSETVSFPDVHAQTMIALRDDARSLKFGWLSEAEIEVRENYIIGETVHLGLTIYELGEVYDDGVIGFEDVGYQCGVAYVARRTTDAKIDSKRYMKRTIEALRRRWKNQRLALNQFDYETVKRHVLRVQHAGLRFPKAIGDKFTGQQLIVTSWTRELPDTE